MGTFLGGLLSGLGVAAIIWLVTWVSKPRINISSVELRNRRNPKTGIDFKWAQLQVNTNSSRNSRRCSAYVVGVSEIELPDKGSEVQVVADKIHIPWSDTSFEIDIARDKPAIADVFRFDVQNLIISHDPEGRNVHTLPGTEKLYRFNVVVESDNARSASACIEVECQEIHKDPKLRLC